MTEELKERKIYAHHLNLAHADKLVEQRGQLPVVATGHLPVDGLAAHSRDAADDDHQRLARPLRLGEAL